MARLAAAVGGLIVAGIAGIGLACAIRTLVPAAEAAPPGPAVAAAPNLNGATPILVELFTSEGCSSCPPADTVATRLERAQPVSGARVIVLAHHVDYWDRLGWTDPWSSAAATARQRSFAPLKSGSYTPQAVVDGRTEMVGSRGAAVEQAVANAAKEAHAKIELEVVPVAGDTGAFDVSTKTAALPAGSAEASFFVAVVQDTGRVVVPRGENAGQTLEHTAIVRSILELGAGGSARTRLRAPAAVEAPGGSTFSVVAFVQERASRKILGVNAAPLTAKR